MAAKNQIAKLVCGKLLVVSAVIPLSAWGQANLESPSDGGLVSGIGVIRGWRCEPPADGLIQIVIDGNRKMNAPYGSARKDTEEVCGDIDNGWGATLNYSSIGEGEHTITVSADGEQFGSETFTVGKPAEENYLRGAPSTYHYMADFPEEDAATVVQWQEKQQNFMIAGSISGIVPLGGTWRNSGDSFDVCWHVADDGSRLTSSASSCGAVAALQIQGEGRDANGQACVIDIRQNDDIPIINGVFVNTFFNQNQGEEEVVSSTYAIFTSESEAYGASITIDVGSRGCKVEFNSNLQQ